LTAVSAIVFFLGLLFGFQRPSRLLPLRLRATVLLLLRCTPFNLGGCTLYFGAAFLSSGCCRFASPLRLAGSPRRAVAPCFFLSRGRGTYFASASRVNSLRRPFFRLAVASSPARLRRFERLRLLPPPRWESTSLADFFISSFTASAGASVASATSLFRPRGRGFYHHRVGSQPRTADSVFLHSASPENPTASAASPSRTRAASDLSATPALPFERVQRRGASPSSEGNRYLTLCCVLVKPSFVRPDPEEQLSVGFHWG